MNEVQSWLFLLLAGAAGIAYLWLSASYKQAPTSRSQSEAVQQRSADVLPPQVEQDRARPPLDVVYPGPTNAFDDAEVDIIAVHGLGSNVDWSWTWKDGEKHVNWLRDPDMLPERVPKSRIMTYNYQSKWHKDAPKTRLQLCGEKLIESIDLFRGRTLKRPIVFVGHSLGGNVIIHALLHAKDDDEYEYLLDATAGVVFLGTPLRGTKWQPFLNSVAQLMGPAGSHCGIIKELEFNGTEVRDKLHRFCRLRNRLSMPVSCFSELYETDYGRRHRLPGVVKGMIVEEASAYIDGLDRHALETDHLKINKYRGPTDGRFLTVSKVISEMCNNANNVVRLRPRQNRREIITDNTYALAQKPDAKDCLRDLFLTDPHEDRKAMKRKKGDRASGTCEWIMGTEELTAWLGSGPTDRSEATQVLWLHGNPGTGKSTMAIFLTEELSEAFSATDGNTLAYFFCDSAFDTRKTATAVIRGLLLQLVQQHPKLLERLLPKYNERGAELFHSFDALWTMFVAAASDENTGRKYCIIDALDECDVESQTTLLKQLEETFCSRNAPPNVHILITSRPYPEIFEHMERFANKDLASYVEAQQDIERCIEERTTELMKTKKYTDKVLTQVKEILRERAEGTFLWVGLACKELESFPSKDAVRVLKDIPKGLSSLYKRLYTRAVASGGKEVELILSFVAVCLRPLSLLELSEACQLHLDEDDKDTRIQFMHDQIASCRLMVVIQDEKVLLLHQSVKDFLHKEGLINDLKAHAELAYRSLDLLIKEFYEKGNSRVIFLDYAITEWPRHAHMANSEFEVKPSLERFFNMKSECCESWLRLYQETTFYDRIPEQFSVLHVAAKWGILALVDHVCCTYNPPYEAEELVRLVEIADAHNVTPLECAARSGHLSVVARLLDLRGKVSTGVLKATAMNSQNGSDVMKLLLEKCGAEVEITPEVVVAAAGNYRNGEAVMKLLLEKRGDEVEITPEVVVAAAGNYRNGEAVMKLLLEKRGGEIKMTPEVVVAAVGNDGNGEAVMKLLLEKRGDEIEITPEVVVAAAGNDVNGEAMMKLLLEKRGDEVEITPEVVVAAARNDGNGEGLMKLLLEKRGGEIKITPEVAVAAAGNNRNGEAVMELLLEKRGGDIKITPEVVVAAVGNKWNGEGLMKLLLEKRGDEVEITP
ncbi:pfs domain-containing protein, partial [Colletotrichum melonis]